MARYARCPECNCRDAEKVTFTWWGGLLGPAMLTHVRCMECGTEYNGKTGKSNQTAIIIYLCVGIGIGLALGGFACLIAIVASMR